MFKNDPDHPLVNIKVHSSLNRGNNSAVTRTSADYYLQSPIAYEAVNATAVHRTGKLLTRLQSEGQRNIGKFCA